MLKKLGLKLVVLFVISFMLVCATGDLSAADNSKVSRMPSKISRSQASKMESFVHKLSKQKKNPTHGLCYEATSKVEAKSAILPNLLTSISVVESGRAVANGGNSRSRARSAWAWTVTANGKGHYYPSKSEAIKAVKDLQKYGVSNIDVGCMQVNLKYHPDAFSSLEQAFDPKRNVEYAAQFLTKLHKETGSWITAAGYYHSRNKTKNSAYVQRLSKAFFDVNASVNQDIAEQAIEEGDLNDVKKLKLARIAANKKHKAAVKKSLGKDMALKRKMEQEKIQKEFKKQQKIANSWREERIAKYARQKAQKAGG